MVREKTYKREVAGAMVVILYVLVIAGIWIPEASAAAESLKYPTFTAAMGAFGIDAVLKQGGR